MNDRLIRGHLPQSNFRFALCQSAGLCSEALGRHQADWVSGWLLSEALTCATLLSVVLKGAEKLTLRWAYPGPVGTVLADTTPEAAVRGFPQRLRIMEEAATLEEAMGGEGQISAITSVPNKVVHTGITPGVFRDIPRDMAHLFSLSYQVESIFLAGIIMPPESPLSVRSAVGILVQPFPGAELERMEDLRKVLEGEDFRTWLEGTVHPLEEVLETLSARTEPWISLEEVTPRFQCGCTRDKVESVLRMFDREELEDMLEQEGLAQVNCHFCAESYTFLRGEIETMIEQSQSGRA